MPAPPDVTTHADRSPDAAPIALHPAVNPDDFLGYTVVRVGHVLSRRFEATLAAHGLTPRQFAVLAHLARDPGLGAGALARLVLITPQSMGALLDELAAAGLVARTPASRGKRRETALTAAGHARLAAAGPAVVAFERAPTAAITAAEGAAANRALQTVLRTLQASDDA
jgi:DNA-binding MarR family transcriptional regulator